MCELVLLIVAVVQRNEDAQIMSTSNHANVGPRELRAYLIEAPGGDALLRAVDVECGDRRVVGGLFGEVRDLDFLPIARRARAAGGGRRSGVVFQRRRCVVDFPVTLRLLVDVRDNQGQTNPEELSQCGVVRLARLAFDVLLRPSQHFACHQRMQPTRSFVNQNRNVPSIRPRASSESPILHSS